MRKKFDLLSAASICALIGILFSAGCNAEPPPARDYAIRLKDREEFLMNEFLLLNTNALTITVENYGLRPTGMLFITLTGMNPDSFDVTPLSLISIPSGASAFFSVQPNEGIVQVKHSAAITIHNGNDSINTTLTVYYREFSGEVDNTLLYGTWKNNNMTLVVSENTFIYRNASAGIDVTSAINSWSQEEWTIGAGTAAGSPGTTLIVYRINCTVEEITLYSIPGDYINALFNIYPKPSPAANGRVSEGQEFSVLLLCKNWAAITGTGSSGINVGILDYSGNNRVPWANFLE